MKNRIALKFSLFIFLLLPLNCGFKVLNKSQTDNYSIEDIITSGDKKIGYKIRNNLLDNYKDNNQNVLILYINVKKSKKIKDKNIKNEITGYQIKINIDVTYNLLGSTGEEEKISFNINGDYKVGEFYSKTINNEKRLLDNLVENISNKISNEIGIRMNDF